MYAPQGTGALFVRRNVRLQPMFFGGLHERGRRPGTENVAGTVGLGVAAELARTADVQALAELRDRLEQGILGAVDEAGVNGGGAARVANTSNLYFDHVEAEALVIALDLKGLAVSGGSACQSGATEPSHVLTAMGLSEAPGAGQCAVFVEPPDDGGPRSSGWWSWCRLPWRGCGRLSPSLAEGE